MNQAFSKLEEELNQVALNISARLAVALICAKVRVETSLQFPCLIISLGEELEAYIASHPEYDRICYTGDGENDFCGILRLRRYIIITVNILSKIQYLFSQSRHCLRQTWSRTRGKSDKRGTKSRFEVSN
jgi:hypothetical protein